MSGNNHAIGLVGWAKMINEAPGANRALANVRNAAPNLNPGSG
jgi:hypothetical protein